MFELPFLSVKFRGMNSAPWKADWRGALLPKTTKWAGFIIRRAFAEVCRELSRYMIKRHLSQLVHSRFGVGHCCTPVATAQVADQQKSSTVDQCLRKGRFFTVIQVNKVCAIDISLLFFLSLSLILSLSLSYSFSLSLSLSLCSSLTHICVKSSDQTILFPTHAAETALSISSVAFSHILSHSHSLSRSLYQCVKI